MQKCEYACQENRNGKSMLFIDSKCPTHNPAPSRNDEPHDEAPTLRVIVLCGQCGEPVETDNKRTCPLCGATWSALDGHGDKAWGWEDDEGRYHAYIGSDR